MKTNHAIIASVIASLFAIATARADVYQDAAKYRFGESRTNLATIEAEIRVAPAAQYPELEAKLLAVLQSPEATADAKRYLVRMLGTVGSAKSVPALAALLADEQLSDCARLALEPMADKAAGNALRDALGKTKGRLLAGIIGSVGLRRDADAVKLLAALTKDPDSDVAAAAIAALGEIGTRSATETLAKISPGVPVARARLACANHLAADGERSAANSIFTELGDPSQPPAIREGALVGLVSNQKKDKAARLLVDAIHGDNSAIRSAAVRVFFKSADTALQRTVVEQLPAMNPAGQTALLAVLGDLPAVPARETLVKMLDQGPDQALRISLMECLVAHGDAEDVPMLMKIALGQNRDESECAKRVLAQMHKPGASEALAKLLPTADASAREIVLAAIVARRSPAAVPVLMKLANTSDAAVAAGALKSIGQIGSATDVSGLVDSILAASDDKVRDGAVASIAAICQRTEHLEPCAKPILAGLTTAPSVAAKCALLRLLPRLKSAEALAAVRQLVKNSDAQLSESALRALADWPDLAAAPSLLDIARTSSDEKLGVLALRGCTRLAGANAPAPERIGLLKNVIEIAKRPDEKREAIAALANIPATESADLIEPFMKDPALSLDAATALTRIAKDIGTLHRERFVTLMQQVKTMSGATDLLRQSADEAVKAMNNSGQADGYIIGWLIAGPYMKEGKDVGALFDEVFDAEKPGASGVAWKAISAPARNGARIIAIDQFVGGGDNRVAYLRTTIQSDTAQDVLLETGSDDGAKIWLNDKQVVAANNVRPCTPGSEKTKIRLKAGSNTLLVKITQGGGQWEFCARLRSTSGGEAQGLTVAPSLD